MDRWAAQWGDQLRIQHKVWVVLLLLCVPLSAGIAIHLYVVQQLLALQQQRQELMLADEQVDVLGRLAIDIEDGFRGYVLTQQPAFLAPLAEAEGKLDQALSDATTSLARLSGSPNSLAPIEQQLKDLLRSKRELIADIQKGQADKALAYVRSGEGLRLSDLLREDFRTVEDRLEKQRNSLNEQADALSQRTFVGLWITLAGVVALGWIVSRILARSLRGCNPPLQGSEHKSMWPGSPSCWPLAEERRMNSVSWQRHTSPWLAASRRISKSSKRSTQ